MNRREILFNLLLLTIIGCLLFLMLTEEHAESSLEMPPPEATGPPPPKSETDYAVAANLKYPRFGNTPLFAPILTPTPTPPPATPTPTPTPNIRDALKAWKLSSAMDGQVTIEDKSKPNDPEGNFFDMKVGDVRPVDIGKGQMKNVILKKVDEKTDPYNPSATFGMDSIPDEHTLKQMEDPGPAPGAPGQPATPVPGPAPQAPRGQ